MNYNNEQGHNINVANFEKLLISCINLGEFYKPNKESLKLTSIEAKYTEAKDSISEINKLMIEYKNAVADRKNFIKDFNKYITRIFNALKASDTTPEIEDAARTIIRKLRGTRATPKTTEEEKQTAKEQGNEIIEKSASQRSFDNLIDNLDKLIKLLASIPAYAPNEEDLSLNYITSVHNIFKDKNMAVVKTETALKLARISRNKILYNEDSGLVDISINVKTYIKSIFGATSPHYKSVSHLVFRNIKN